jgi:CRISPR-associated protein Cas5d
VAAAAAGVGSVVAVARPKPFTVRVWGEFACFTRPEMKVERVSYPVMTPSAARGLLESIFWRPGLTWRVLQIAVLRPIRYQTIVRNELASKQSLNTVYDWIRTGRGGYEIDHDRAQRQTIALRDVAYVLTAELTTAGAAAVPAPIGARDQFRRRLQRGQCRQGPYLGCREFRCDFSADDGTAVAPPLNSDLGTMLLDIDYDRSGRRTPRFFHARLENGVLHVPLPAAE